MNRIAMGGHGVLPFRTVVVADTETTGLAPFGVREGAAPNDPWGPDRLCSAAFLRLSRVAEGRWEVVGTLSVLCDPGRPVPEGAAKVNGFHWSGDGSQVPAARRDLAGLGTFEERSAEVAAFIGSSPLVCHNAVFDLAVLDAELVRAGMDPLFGPVLCTKAAFSDLQGLGRPDEYVPGTNLNALSDLLGVDRSARVGPDGSELHGAEVDAWMAAQCFPHLDAAGWLVPRDACGFPHRVHMVPALGRPTQPRDGVGVA